MNKIPKCLTRNPNTRHYYKLTKKYTGENRLINNNNNIINRERTLNLSKHFSKESINSMISTMKPSILTTTSSRNNSMVIHKKVINIIYFIS